MGPENKFTKDIKNNNICICMNANYETTEKIVRYWLNVGLSNLLLEEQRPANLI